MGAFTDGQSRHYRVDVSVLAPVEAPGDNLIVESAFTFILWADPAAGNLTAQVDGQFLATGGGGTCVWVSMDGTVRVSPETCLSRDVAT